MTGGWSVEWAQGGHFHSQIILKVVGIFVFRWKMCRCGGGGEQCFDLFIHDTDYRSPEYRKDYFAVGLHNKKRTS